MIQYREGDYQKSLSNFQNAFDIKQNGNVSDYFYASAAALHLSKTKKAKNLIIAAIISKNASKDYFLRFEEFGDFRKNKIFDEIENNYQEYAAQYFNQLDHPEIYREIDSLTEIDQKIRRNNLNHEERYRIDSLNVIRLKEITKKYGWRERGWIILWHQRFTFEEDNYVWSFFRPYINEQIKKGNIRTDFWAMFEDQKAIEKNQTQIYGTYLSQLNQFPVRNLKNIDKKRKKVGLAPLWYMHKVYGAELPENYNYPTNPELTLK